MVRPRERQQSVSKRDPDQAAVGAELSATLEACEEHSGAGIYGSRSEVTLPARVRGVAFAVYGSRRCRPAGAGHRLNGCCGVHSLRGAGGTRFWGREAVQRLKHRGHHE